jgi:4-alpha-glucanotransferase
MTAPRIAPPKALSRRSAGLLLHMTSLPSRYGIGDLGPEAHRWIDILAASGQTWWQILPLNAPDDSNSPYSALSAFAGNPNLISPELLVRDGYLHEADVPHANFPADRVAFDHVKAFKATVLGLAWERFNSKRRSAHRAAFSRFCRKHADWLDDFALFMAIREQHVGMSWTEWPADLLQRKPAALAAAKKKFADAFDRQRFIQFLFDAQLAELRKHAAKKNVRILGDMPIYVAGQSADVWAHPQFFQLDEKRKPRAVAGVPPDIFSKTGQLWGNPLYDWKRLERDGYRWWIARLRNALRHADVIRIDHFRGLAGFWSVRASEATAQRGRWVKGPGAKLLAAMRRALGDLPVVAEDLGVITPDVIALRDDFALPGMQVLQFAFGEDDSPMLPHHHTRNAIVYTGTHDNPTTRDWFDSLAKEDRARLQRYAPETTSDPAGALVRLAWSSVANTAIAPVQDLLRLGPEGRMNMPGVGEGNWGWRLTGGALSKEMLAQLCEMTAAYGRSARPSRR